MPHLTITWDDPAESIVLLDVHADYTWDEFNAAVAQVSALAAAKPYRCDILVNLGKYSAESSGIPAIQKALGALDHLPQNVGLIVIVVGGLAGLIFNAAKRLDSRVATRARTAQSVEKARELIGHARRSA
ncbi:MAG: hypothetical protein IPK52_20710 [Chloroflexi bacterium]|nr:hypothetical protein [Chloroflexota bacterium]